MTLHAITTSAMRKEQLEYNCLDHLMGFDKSNDGQS